MTKHCLDCDAEEEEEHGDGCEESTITKREVMEMLENYQGKEIDTYLFWLKEDGISREDAKEMASGFTLECFTCALEIGSCHGGGCMH